MRPFTALAFAAIVVAIGALGFYQAASGGTNDLPACFTICNCGEPLGECRCVWDCEGMPYVRVFACAQWCDKGCGINPC